MGSVFDFIILVYNFGCLSLQKIWGQKHAEFGMISDDLNFDGEYNNYFRMSVHNGVLMMECSLCFVCSTTAKR